MKKSDVGMLIAVCAMLYTAGIMRRPVFLYELNLAPLNDFVLHFFGNSVFVLRMISVFAVFICTFCIWLICRMNKAEKNALIAPLFFLTNFFIFFNGISGGSAALGGCLWVAVITCGFAVLTVTVLWKKIVAGAAAAALLFTAVHFRLTAPGQNLQLWWTMLLPWGIFLPVLVRNVWGRRQEILQNKLSLFGIFFTVFPLITAVVLRRSDALCGAIAASSVLLAQLVNLTEKKAFDRTLTYFSAVVLPFPVLFFLLFPVIR